ncbi:GNAT family N-acetyltransferase [Streptomyces uncialis]|uniref:GNAT family N-acetyltransferase n=1 Tax=Streptomyces uncialis TaxID=1048205 RepID=UPI00379B5854
MGHDVVDVRAVAYGELADWLRALNTGFLREPTPTAHDVDIRRRHTEAARTTGAFDRGRCVATYRSFGQELTVPGGAVVTANAVSNVTVSPTHRRRGLLTRMIDADLRAARERGDLVATLIAAEYPIYGRYGFGPATSVTEWSIDVSRSGLDPRWSRPERDGARIELVNAEDVRVWGPEFYDRVRRAQPGATSRDAVWWQMETGELRLDASPWKEDFQVAYRAPDGQVTGLLAYGVDDKSGDGTQPENTARVKHLLALDPDAERALWHYLCAVDWITTVRTGMRAPDALVPHLLPDPRAARVVRHADWLWVRLLDVAGALEARTYGSAGSLVLDVVDEPGGAGGVSGGRFRLEASPQGAVCARTDAPADLTLSLGDLGSLWLGDGSVARLVALGRVVEEREGAVAVADALFRTPRRPWCPDVF